MFPLPRYDLHRQQKMQARANVRVFPGEDVPELDLGKKVSVPQDLMMEELDLPINRGSKLYQQRQKRMQRFVLEYPTSYRIASNRTVTGSLHPISEADATEGQMLLHNAEGKENYPTQHHVATSGKGAPPAVPRKTDKVLRMSRALNPDGLAPGYSGPLKEVPPEKFNRTAIPKAYQSPWREFLSSEDYQVDSETRLPEPPRKVNPVDLRSFNRTPTPFGGPLLNDVYMIPGFEMNEVQTDTMSSLELMLNRPSFNRAPRGWVQIMPESEEL